MVEPYAGVDDFVARQMQLINLERDAEIDENRKLHDNVPAKQLQENGVCLLNLVLLNLRSGLFGRSIASFACRVADKELPSSDFSSGECVLLKY